MTLQMTLQAILRSLTLTIIYRVLSRRFYRSDAIPFLSQQCQSIKGISTWERSATLTEISWQCVTVYIPWGSSNVTNAWVPCITTCCTGPPPERPLFSKYSCSMSVLISSVTPLTKIVRGDAAVHKWASTSSSSRHRHHHHRHHRPRLHHHHHRHFKTAIWSYWQVNNSI